jgi:hypothetical protein
MHAIVKAVFVAAFDVSSDLKRQQALVFHGASAVMVGDVWGLRIVRCATASPS